MKAATDILRDLADLAIRRGLDGRTFPDSVERTAEVHGREAPAEVRQLAMLIRWRGQNLSAWGVAAVLRGRARAGAGASGELQA